MFLPFAAMIVQFGVVWPVGSALDLGQWVESESDDGGWTFIFDEEFRRVGWMVALLFVAQLVALVKVVQRLSPTTLAANPKYREFPTAEKTVDSWGHHLKERTPALLFDYESEAETNLLWEQRPFWAGGCLLNVSPILAALTVGFFGSGLGPGPSEPRIFILLGFYALAMALLVYGAKIVKSQPKIDDRLIFDFEKNEVQRIALHDPFCKPERWFGFDTIDRLVFTKRVFSSGAVSDSSLDLKAPDICLKLFWRESGNCESLIRKIADKFSAKIETETVQLSDD